MSEQSDIQATQIKINTEIKSANTEVQNRRYAGFWMRFWAFLIDSIVIGSVNIIILSPFNLGEQSNPIIGTLTIYGLIASITFYLYFLLMTKYFTQTIGKMILGIRVIRADGTILQWSDLLFREVIGRFIQTVFSLLNLLYLIVGFTSEKEGIHDMLARTRVIHVE